MVANVLLLKWAVAGLMVANGLGLKWSGTCRFGG